MEKLKSSHGIWDCLNMKLDNHTVHCRRT